MIDLKRFQNIRVFVVGDFMLDEYVLGDVDRISPEAPVQVVNVQNETYTLGGAGNVVNNLRELGAKVTIAGVIGTDAKGDLLVESLKQKDADTRGLIREEGRPTTRKTRIIASGQHVLRIDRETRDPVSKDSSARLSEFIRKNMAYQDVVVISDYGKGVVTRSLIREMVDAKAKDQWVVLDPKSADFSMYTGVSVMTPNRREASLATGIKIENQEDLALAAQRVFSGIQLEILVITCGKDGMTVFFKNGESIHITQEARQVYDVSGAGDTVVSVLGLGLGAGFSAEESARLANQAAGIVVGKLGTATVSPKELENAWISRSYGIEAKYKSLFELSAILQNEKKAGKKIVLTNGCFDLLHAGHIMLLSRSGELGDILVVAIDDDASVRKHKGEGRPVLCAEERVRILCALNSVTYVIVFQTDELPDLIASIQPDYLTKGDNYAEDEIAGKQAVEALGGKVVRFPVAGNHSSSGIIDSIRKGSSPL